MKKIDQNKKDSKLWREVKSWVIVILIALGLKATIIEAYQIPTGSMENTILIGDFILGNRFVFGVRTPDRIGIPWTKIGFKIPWFRLPGFRKPKQGDVIIFKYPEDPSLNYIKRCVAGPGQIVKIENRVLKVDGEVFQNPEHLKFINTTPYPQYYKDRDIFPAGAGNKDFYGPIHVPAKGDTLRPGITPTDIIKNVVELAGHKFITNPSKVIIDGKPYDYYVVEQDHYFMMGDNRDNSWDSRFWGFVPFNMVLGEGLIIYLSINKEIPLYRLWNKIRWKRIGRIVQ
jgi:signal peptidase I